MNSCNNGSTAFANPTATWVAAPGGGGGKAIVFTQFIPLGGAASGEVGELFSSSPYLYNGYWGRPEETAETFRGVPSFSAGAVCWWTTINAPNCFARS